MERPRNQTVGHGRPAGLYADGATGTMGRADSIHPRAGGRTAPVRTIAALAAALTIVALVAVLALPTGASASAPFTPQCSDPFPASRTAGNPLMLSPAPPASNPLAGAQFFVDGPAHGLAAGAIAQLLGLDTSTTLGSPLPSFPDSESWATFSQYVQSHLASVSPAVQHQITELEKIAAEPETNRISRYSAGGTPGGIYAQMQKLFCHNFTADPGSIPVFTTYFLHATLGGCPTAQAISAYRPTFESQIDAIAKATGHRPVVYLLELDAIGSSSCIAKSPAALAEWESLLSFEATTLGALPHTVVYLEGGYSDANSPAYAAKILNASGIQHVAGFWTNDTHLNWTSKEISYGDAISKLTHGAHFVINTDDNGNGPLLNPNPAKQGIESLCNPPNRALGPQPTTATGQRLVDAYLWTNTPGTSDGSCNGGPPSGSFWVARAVAMAQAANAQLGPGGPSRPY